MTKFGESSVTVEAKQKQDDFIKTAFLMANNELAKEILKKKKHLSTSIQGLLYAHLLAISRKDMISLRKLFEKAIKDYVVNYYNIYPAIAELQRFFIEEELRNMSQDRENKKKELRKLIEGK